MKLLPYYDSDLTVLIEGLLLCFHYCKLASVCRRSGRQHLALHVPMRRVLETTKSDPNSAASKALIDLVDGLANAPALELGFEVALTPTGGLLTREKVKSRGVV